MFTLSESGSEKNGNPVIETGCIRLTSDNNTSPDRIRYFGDPISAFDLDVETIMPSFKQRFNIVHIHILVNVYKMLCLSMMLSETT